MNISIDLIKQYADARQKLMDSGVISSFIIDGELHVSAVTLVNEDGLKIEDRGDDRYPYELYVMIDGIKIFGLMSEEEFAKYPQLQCYMIEDVNLTGNDGDDHAA
jgi:hypothetical protein